MSQTNNPSVVTNGLVVAIDPANIKSYKGPAFENKLTSISQAGIGTSTGYAVSYVTETSYIPQLGLTTYSSVLVQNNYTSYSPNSANCCPSLFQYGGFAVIPSTQYTYGIVYKCDSGYSHANYMYRYEYTSNGGTYVTEGGVFANGGTMDLGAGWVMAWGTFTTQSTTNWISSSGLYYYRYSPYNDRVSVAKAFVAQGNWVGLHAKYWTNPATTRSSTNVLFDLMGNSNIDAVSLTYTSSTFTYVGTSSNYISLGNTSYTQFPYNNPWSFQIIVKVTAFANTYPGFIYKGNSGLSGIILFYISNGQLIWKNNNAQVYLTTLTFGNTYILAATHDGSSNMKFYLNGNLIQTAAGAMASTSTETSTNLMLGRADEYGSHDIYQFMKYNRELSSAEVMQNFLSLRSKYNL